jgi:hypothetical protein
VSSPLERGKLGCVMKLSMETKEGKRFYMTRLAWILLALLGFIVVANGITLLGAL